MRYLSVCSGIEAASVAWHPLGWQPVAFSEIEPFPSAVLAHHYPSVPNWGDMTRYQEWPDADVDVLVGGTPCQSFSVAGLRKGLDDPRGNLMLTFGAIAQRYRPRWLVWENVPGVLSSGGGRDFGTFLGMLAELGYGFAYRVLDAQYVRVDSHPRAVPQRRRRVFVVGHLGDWRRAAAVLFERESLSGHPAPRREAGERTTSGSGECPTVSSKWAKQSGGHAGAEHYNLTVEYVGNAEGGAEGVPFLTASNLANHLNNQTPLIAHAAAFNAYQRTVSDVASPIQHDDERKLEKGVMQGMAVRRLTPRECERLQGFPDDYTDIPWRGKKHAPDGPRYKALGNSMAVNVMSWVGQRIAMVEEITERARRTA